MRIAAPTLMYMLPPFLVTARCPPRTAPQTFFGTDVSARAEGGRSRPLPPSAAYCGPACLQSPTLFSVRPRSLTHGLATRLG